MGDAAVLRGADDLSLERAEDDAPATSGAYRRPSMMARLGGQHPVTTAALALLLTGGGVGAGSLLGDARQAEIDAIRRDVEGVKSDVAGVTAAQADAQIELLEAQNEQLQYNAGQGFWLGDHMRKLSGALTLVGQKLELDLDVAITPLTRDGR